MKVHVFQHAPFEGLGTISSWLEARSAEIHRTRFYSGESIPALDDIDLLVAMGGPMSVNDEAAFPWLAHEKQAVRETVSRNIPVLGVCLGAQLIASALGARVYPNSVKEIGWFPIDAVNTPAAFRFPAECTVFHWHGETFDLPIGAVHLAKSDCCENQAFQVGPNVIGLQFHLEMTPSGMRGMLDNCRHELVPGPCTQTEAELRATPGWQYQTANNIMNEVLTYLVGPEALGRN